MFDKDRINFCKSILTKKHGAIPEGMDDCEPAQPLTFGTCSVAETGSLHRRKSSLGIKIKSKLMLQMRRFSVLQSEEYQRRLQFEFDVPKENDVSNSTFGLLRATLDPTYRDKAIGDVWQYTSGVRCGNEIREKMIRDAKENHDKTNRRGSYSAGQTKLRESTSFLLSPIKTVETSAVPVIRRSERLKQKQETR